MGKKRWKLSSELNIMEMGNGKCLLEFPQKLKQLELLLENGDGMGGESD